MKSASISILVNGSPTSEFVPQRGLRQGDPLAPFLFNIVAEGLNGLMRRAVEENMYKGYLVGANNVPISILQYADDTIFFGEASMENVEAIKAAVGITSHRCAVQHFTSERLPRLVGLYHQGLSI